MIIVGFMKDYILFGRKVRVRKTLMNRADMLQKENIMCKLYTSNLLFLNIRDFLQETINTRRYDRVK